MEVIEDFGALCGVHYAVDLVYLDHLKIMDLLFSLRFRGKLSTVEGILTAITYLSNKSPIKE